MAALGEPFDPHRHIAIDSVPASEDAAAGTVVAEYRRGYAQGERLLRLAEVVVARAHARGSNANGKRAANSIHDIA